MFSIHLVLEHTPHPFFHHSLQSILIDIHVLCEHYILMEHHAIHYIDSQFAKVSSYLYMGFLFIFNFTVFFVIFCFCTFFFCCICILLYLLLCMCLYYTCYITKVWQNVKKSVAKHQNTVIDTVVELQANRFGKIHQIFQIFSHQTLVLYNTNITHQTYAFSWCCY